MIKSDIILHLENLTIAYLHAGRWLDAVRDVSLDIRAGETYGLVGESGSGKTTLALAIMGYLGGGGSVKLGEIKLDGQDLLALNENELREVWGSQIAFVPQNPQSSLNPSLRIGEQIAETLRYHQGFDKTDAHQKAIQLLEKVHIADAGLVANSYPHQISGGMQQRVMIAMALSTEPMLLVLDEPTTNLDVTTQAVILDLVRELIQNRQTAVLYVTHNLGVVAQLCDRVGVLYAGELVEEANTDDLYQKPVHPYTRGLLDSIPRLGEVKGEINLRAIQGQIPALDERASGCVFQARCPVAVEQCGQRPPIFHPTENRWVRCHRWEDIYRGQISVQQPEVQDVAQHLAEDSGQGDVLKLERLEVYFPLHRSLNELVRRSPARLVRAVDGVSVNIPARRTLGLVGESGSGKTTISRAIVGLVPRTGGSVQLLDFPLAPELKDRDLETLRHLQMVFQNPEEALNPYLTIGETLRRPLVTLLGYSGQVVEVKVKQLLEAVRLPASYANRLPDQLSGGEKQRVAIARAFASNPDVLICDEPVSALDVSVQASILNLLSDLQMDHDSSILFISHNLAVVSYLADQVAVIYLGHIMEVAGSKALFEPPYSPYTEALLSAIPMADPQAEQRLVRLEGEIPSPADVPSGCPFHTRCPRYLGEICADKEPPWQTDPETGKRYYCHIPPEDLRQIQEHVFRTDRTLNV